MNSAEQRELEAEHRQTLRSAIAQQHNQWSEHPTTQTMLSAVRKHKESFVGLIGSNVNNASMTDAAFRSLAVNIRNTDAILVLLTDAKQFAEFMVPEPKV